MIETKDRIEAVVTNLRHVLRTWHVTSNLVIPIWTFTVALRYNGVQRDVTIMDARNELLDCIHDEEDNDNAETAARLRSVLRI